MPTIDQIQGKVTDYQNNGALNALVHVLVPRIVGDAYGNDANDPHASLKQNFCAAFDAEWGTYLSWEQLQAKLRQVTDPVAREQLLGPVLRRMLGQNFSKKKDGHFIQPSAFHVAKLANVFNIAVVEHVDSTKTRLFGESDSFTPLGLNTTRDVLRLVNTEEGVRFYTANSQTHNEAYTDLPQSALDYDRAAPVLQAKLKQSISEIVVQHEDNEDESCAAGEAAINKANFAGVFEGHKQEAKEAEAKNPGLNFNGLMKNLNGGIKEFFSADQANPFGPLSGVMKIFEALMGSFMPMIFGMQKKIEEMMRKPGDPLRPEEISQEPAYGLGAPDFADFVASISEDGEGGFRKAQILNALWREQFNAQGALKSDAKMAELWVDVVKGLEDHAGFDKAFECLDKQEQKLLKKLQDIKAELPEGTSNDTESASASAWAKINTLITSYDAQRKAIDALNPTGAALLPQEQKVLLKARLDLFKQVAVQVQSVERQHAPLLAQKKLTARLKAEHAVVKATVATATTGTETSMAETLAKRLRSAQAALEAAGAAEIQLAAQEKACITKQFDTAIAASNQALFDGLNQIAAHVKTTVSERTRNNRG